MDANSDHTKLPKYSEKTKSPREIFGCIKNSAYRERIVLIDQNMEVFQKEKNDPLIPLRHIQ